MKRIYTVTVSGCPALGAFNVPQVHAVTATCARVAVNRTLQQVPGIERYLRRGQVHIKVSR